MKNHLQEIEVNGLVYGAKTMTFHMSCAFWDFLQISKKKHIWKIMLESLLTKTIKDPLIFRNCSPILLVPIYFRNARFTQWVKGNPILLKWLNITCWWPNPPKQHYKMQISVGQIRFDPPSLVKSPEITIVTYLVGGIPTPLKNDGVRQLGWFSIPNWMESHVIQPCSKPPTSI